MGYFAVDPVNEFLPKLKQKIERFHRYKESTGEFAKWRRSYNLYFGNHVDASDSQNVSKVGEDGELTAYGINYYRNLVKHFLALTCSQKPSYDYRSKNSDLVSQQQARLANSVIDGYLVEKRMGRHMKQAAERALVFKLGYTFTQWDTTQGRELMPEPVLNDDGTPKLDDDGQPIQKIKYEGDPTMTSKSPWDIIHDVDLRDWSKNKWVIVKEFENKYDLGAQYPKYKDEIEALAKNYDFKEYSVSRVIQSMVDQEDGELIPVYYFYHLPTSSLPSGRFTKFLTTNICLYDGAYPYGKKLPVNRITPGEMFDTVDGYSDFYDIMVLQQVLNMNASTILTNQNAFGVQSVWIPGNANITSEQLSNGMHVLKGGTPDSKPQPLNLTATPAEVFKNGEMVKAAMKELVGLSDAVTGNADQNKLSGIAITRLQAMAYQYSSNFQQSWAELQEDNGTFMIYLLQNFAGTKRMTASAGKYNKNAMESWTGKDLDQIDRIVCDVSNPLFKTYAGRMDLADKFLDKGLIHDISKYYEVVETGNIEPLFESDVAKSELIRKENEILMSGGPVMAMPGDTHLQHSREHLVILYDPKLRESANNGDPLASQIFQNVTNHIMEHNELHHTQDPYWFMISGEQPPPPPMPPQGPPQGAPGEPLPPMMGPPPMPDGPPPVPGAPA
jgi:hypothetical protein